MFVLSREGGILGHLVADRLHRMGHPVAILGGDGEHAESIRIDDGRAVQRALGYAKALLILPPGPKEKNLDEDLLRELALEARTSRVIRISLHGADSGSPHQALARAGRLDEALLASGLSASVLRPHVYMQDLMLFAPAIKQGRGLIAPDSDPKVAFVDVRDVADAAAALMQRPFHMGETYDITGPRAWSMSQTAHAIGEAIGMEVPYHGVPLSDYAERLEEDGLEPKRARHVAETLAAYGQETQRTRSMARITGLPPRALEMFLLDQRSHFATKVMASGPTFGDAEVVHIDHPLTW